MRKLATIQREFDKLVELTGYNPEREMKIETLSFLHEVVDCGHRPSWILQSKLRRTVASRSQGLRHPRIQTDHFPRMRKRFVKSVCCVSKVVV